MTDSPAPLTPSPPERLAALLGVSREAVELCRSSDVIDLHVDTFIPYRIWGYDIASRHRGGPLGRHFAGHFDIPRALDGGLSGGMFSITTNPARTETNRWSTLLRNITRFRDWIEANSDNMQLCSTLSDYETAHSQGKLAVFPSIQGGNSLEGAPNGFSSVPKNFIVRVTLVHLTNSQLGASSSPACYLRRHRGLSPRGRRLVRDLDEHRCFVDLAHIHSEGFWDAVQEHDASLPLIVTHTGVNGVKSHWRNLDDAQIKAIADTGGTIGIIFEPSFLRPRGAANDADLVIAHAQHVIDVVGEQFVSIGSDFDGAITPPTNLKGADFYPVLVQKMLDRGWSERRIRQLLGENALRVIGLLRP